MLPRENILYQNCHIKERKISADIKALTTVRPCPYRVLYRPMLVTLSCWTKKKCQLLVHFILKRTMGRTRTARIAWREFKTSLLEKTKNCNVQGRVVRKPVNVNWSIAFSYLTTFFTACKTELSKINLVLSCLVLSCLVLVQFEITTAQNWRVNNINRLPNQKYTKLKSKFSLTLG